MGYCRRGDRLHNQSLDGGLRYTDFLLFLLLEWTPPLIFKSQQIVTGHAEQSR
jgi:hypothetical protein